jgi:hypothetical protein
MLMSNTFVGNSREKKMKSPSTTICMHCPHLANSSHTRVCKKQGMIKKKDRKEKEQCTTTLPRQFCISVPTGRGKGLRAIAKGFSGDGE